jgi:hypothetical protein
MTSTSTSSNIYAAASGDSSVRGSISDSSPCLAVTLAAVAVALADPARAGAATGTLLVHLHVPMKQRAFQSKLGAGLPGVTATAVGRVADFDRALQDAPDAVLTLPVVLSAKGLSLALRGTMRGSTEERYALLGAGNTPDPARVASVGAIDILGREGTNRFVRSLIGAQAHVERVTKMEDLLPLLQLQQVEAVLLPSRFVAELRATSRLPLSERELETTVGLPAAASTGPNGPAVLDAIRKMPNDLSGLLGVDAWR